MTLGTHAIVGAATATLFPSHPVTAFFAGFCSHFILDAIPHWDYKILSEYANSDRAMSSNVVNSSKSKELKPDRYFWLDILRTGADTLLGFIIIFIVWYSIVFVEWKVLILGAIGGILPDFLQFVYMRFPNKMMSLLQKFHTNTMHSSYRLNNRPIIGIISQIIVIVAIVWLTKYLIQY